MVRSTSHPDELRQREDIQIQVGPAVLDGVLESPPFSANVALLAHSSGSSRWSHRSRFLAREFRTHGMCTFLFDMLTPEEELCYRSHFDIDVLTTRLDAAVNWLRSRPVFRDASIGVFASSTAAAAALKAAVRNRAIGAVVSRGGRPDLAGGELRLVQCPTLLIAGSRDYDVLRLNRRALEEMSCRKELAIVPQATHLFEEPGALESVSRLAVRWFEHYLDAERSGGGRNSGIAAAG